MLISLFPMQLLAAMSVVHCLSLVLLKWFPSNPAPHTILEDHKQVISVQFFFDF